MASDWKTRPTLRRCGGLPRTLSPKMRISPVVGASRPAIIRIVVVLPQPEGPRIETISPGKTSRLTPSTARILPRAKIRDTSCS
jgi:hypothetical protein